MQKPKYIITKDNEFIFSHVELHMDLLPYEQRNQIAGGGWWHLDNDDKELILYGTSIDFGHVTMEQIIDCFKNGIVPKALANTVEKVFYSSMPNIGYAKKEKMLILLQNGTSFTKNSSK